MNLNKQNKPYLICHAVRYYGISDKKMFFEWVKKINCIERSDRTEDIIYLYLKSDILIEDDLYELLFFFKRYEIDITQLKPFLNNENKRYFFKSREAFWFEPLFGKSEIQ